MILILGRFQPLHKGHMKVLEDAYQDDKRIIIAIGSAQEKRTKLNPFSAVQRKIMLEKSLKVKNIPAKIFFIPDIKGDGNYVHHIENIIKKKPGKIITENPWTVSLFKKAGYDVILTPRHFNISATEIRKRLTNRKKWKDMVPDEVAKYIDKINGENLIKTIA
ncbi:nicotinamide-nucleotide adenylyltransferase [Candidatus Woesearchaeota archaeon]|nr:nicotinamide-nucleotide adenylyltransferase [Candidatus Woesearchaeota archaeon]